MKEKHFAYKISRDSSGIVCTQCEFEEDKMLDLLREIQELHYKGIYWIFKQIDGQPQEALSIIDCGHNRIYYHYSGDVESIEDTIEKLSNNKSKG
jgi:hypothetical protein